MHVVFIFYCYHNKLPWISNLRQYPFIISQFPWVRSLGTLWPSWALCLWSPSTKIKDSAGLYSLLEPLGKNPHPNSSAPRTMVLQGQWCFKDKGQPCLEKCQRYTPYQTLSHPPRHVVIVMKFLSPPGQRPPGQQDLCQIRKGICPVPLQPYRRKVYVPRPSVNEIFTSDHFFVFWL